MHNDSKVCKDCKIEKPSSEFYKNKCTKDKLGIYCKECHAVRSRKSSKKYRTTEKGKAKHREEERKRRLNNLEHVRKLSQKNNQKYRRNNPEKRKITVSISQHKRRVQKLAQGQFLITKKFYKKLYFSACVQCGSYEKINADHIVPISRGGIDSEGNLQPLCSVCNSSKGNKLMIEWKIYLRKGN